MYLVFQSKHEPSDVVATINDGDFAENWTSGVRFQHPPPSPLSLRWTPKNEDGMRLSYYGVGTVLLRKDLASAMTTAGVDNLDIYPVVIESARGRPACEDYVAVNILGVVDAMDRDASEIDDEDPDLVFVDGIVIDPSRTAEQRFFRLADAGNVVIIHKDIASRINAPALGLDCIDPANHVG